MKKSLIIILVAVVAIPALISIGIHWDKVAVRRMTDARLELLSELSYPTFIGLTALSRRVEGIFVPPWRLSAKNHLVKGIKCFAVGVGLYEFGGSTRDASELFKEAGTHLDRFSELI